MMTLWGKNYYYHLWFTDEEIEAQRHKVTCSKPCSWETVELGLELRKSGYRLWSTVSGVGPRAKHWGNSNEAHRIPALKEITINQPRETIPKREVHPLQNDSTDARVLNSSSNLGEVVYPCFLPSLWVTHIFRVKNDGVTHLLAPSCDTGYPMLKTSPQIPHPWISYYSFCHFHDNLSNVLNFLFVGCQANSFLALSKNSLFKMPHITEPMILNTFFFFLVHLTYKLQC